MAGLSDLCGLSSENAAAHVSGAKADPFEPRLGHGQPGAAQRTSTGIDCRNWPQPSGDQDAETRLFVGGARTSSAMLFHVLCLPEEPRMTQDDPSQAAIAREQLGLDFPGAVEPLEELQLILLEG